MYYVGDADGDNDTNCRSRSRSQQHCNTGMTCYDEARRCPTTLMSRSRLSAECVVVVALWGDIYIKADVEQHLGNRNNSHNLTLTKSKPLPLPDQTNQAIKQIKSHTRVFTQRPEKKKTFV